MLIYKILLFIGIMFTISAQLLLKSGMQNITIGLDKGVYLLIIAVLKNFNLWISAILYGIGFFIYSIVLTKIELSKAYPVVSIVSIVIIILLSVVFIGEKLTISQALGTCLALVSIWFLLA